MTFCRNRTTTLNLQPALKPDHDERYGSPSDKYGDGIPPIADQAALSFQCIKYHYRAQSFDIEKAREVTADFTNYLRMSFDFQNTSGMSSFKHELSIVNSYLSIEKRASAIGWTSFTILRKTSTLPFRL